MAQTIMLGSNMARKKPVEAKYSPNTYRVISGEAEEILVQRPRKPSEVFTPDVNTIGQLPDVKLPSPYDHRQNRPNETHVGFLNSDVRILNAPICDVYTKRTQDEQPLWWPHRNDGEKLKAPGHPLDSTCRYDYQYRGNEVRGSTRHSSNPNKSPALGSVPINFLRERDGKQRIWKEGISYEHQYNSRLDPQYPIRSKRHGSFVWDRFPTAEVDRMLYHYGIVPDKQQQATGSLTKSTKKSASKESITVPKNLTASPTSCQTAPAKSASLTSNEPPTDNWVPLSDQPRGTDSLCNAVKGAPVQQQDKTRCNTDARKPVQLPPII